MQAVEAAFPANLLYPGEPTSQKTYDTCAAVFRRNAEGSPDLIAAAYSGQRAEVAMLAYQSRAVRVLDAVNRRQSDFDGGSCDASIVSRADPGTPSSLLSR